MTSFRSQEKDLLKYVKNRELLKVDLLPRRFELESIYAMDIPGEEERYQKICRAYERKVDLLDWMNFREPEQSRMREKQWEQYMTERMIKTESLRILFYHILHISYPTKRNAEDKQPKVCFALSNCHE